MKINLASEKGQAMVILVIALVALMGFVGLAVDGGIIYSERRFAQNASDASSLSGGGAAALSLENSQVVYWNWNCNDSRVVAAQQTAIAAAIQQAQVNSFTIDGSTADNNGASTRCDVVDNGSYVDKYIDVTSMISHTIGTYFVQFVYSGPMIDNVQAITRVRPRSPLAFGNAVFATREDCPNSDTGGVHFDGNNQVNISGGGIFSNACIRSGGSVDVNVTGTGGITCIGADCYKESGNPGMSPAPKTGDYRLPPFSMEVPEPSCDGLASKSVHGDTMSPGHYSNVRINNGDELTMEPGLYCVDNFRMNGGKLNGEGVTIYITTGDFIITGGEIVLSSPPARNCDDSICPPALPGVLIYLSRDNTGEIALLGNAHSDYLGLVYAPDGTIELGGTAGETSQVHAQLVADTVKLHGNAELILNYDDEENYQKAAMIELFK